MLCLNPLEYLNFSLNLNSIVLDHSKLRVSSRELTSGSGMGMDKQVIMLWNRLIGIGSSNSLFSLLNDLVGFHISSLIHPHQWNSNADHDDS